MRLRVVVIASSLLVGCVAQNDPRLRKPEEVAAQVIALEAQIKALQSQVQSLEDDVLGLQLGLQVASERYTAAIFDPSDPGGYQRIDTRGGTFLVSLQNVTPYVDGFRVTCNFGNPSSVTFNGFTLKVKWGPRFDFKVTGMKLAEWQASLREREVSLTSSLQGGYWNRVSFVVSPAKAEEFGYLELSMKTDSVSLRK